MNKIKNKLTSFICTVFGANLFSSSLYHQDYLISGVGVVIGAIGLLLLFADEG